MKKILSIFLFSFIATVIFATPAFAQNSDKVVDVADLLTDAEETKLEKSITNIIEKYNFDVVIVTTNTLENKTSQAYADDYFDYNGYGVGDSRDGILFLVSMEDRDYYISTSGYGLNAFTDYGIGKIEDKVVSDLSDGEYNNSFSKFIDYVDKFLKEAKDNKPYDTNNKYVTSSERVITIAVIFIIAFIIGLISVSIMKSGMNNVVDNKFARDYVRKDSLNLSRQSDIFLYSNVTKVKRESSSSSSGGSSSHTSSSGSSHGGHGGKF